MLSEPHSDDDEQDYERSTLMDGSGTRCCSAGTDASLTCGGSCQNIELDASSQQ